MRAELQPPCLIETAQLLLAELSGDVVRGGQQREVVPDPFRILGPLAKAGLQRFQQRAELSRAAGAPGAQSGKAAADQHLPVQGAIGR